jgi:hypothetical protein
MKIYTFKMTATEYIKMWRSSSLQCSHEKKCNFLRKSNIFKFPVKIFAHALRNELDVHFEADMGKKREGFKENIALDYPSTYKKLGS